MYLTGPEDTEDNPVSPHLSLFYSRLGLTPQHTSLLSTIPAVTSGKVLVTGANGFVASWVVKHLLEAGYSVRGTVRSQSKVPHLQKTFGYGDKVEFVVVDDITRPGAFDEYVKDVDAIEHTAAPYHFNFEDPNDYIRPAVQGTINILESALKFGKNLKRVVVASSVAAVQTVGLTEVRTHTEKDWNEQSIKEVETKGKAAEAVDKYCASKTLGEKAAFDFVEKHKGEIGWDVAAVSPPFIFGPVIHDVSEPSKLNSSMDTWYTTVMKGTADKETLGEHWKEVAGGNRFITSAGNWKGQDLVNAARKIDPSIHPGSLDYKPEKAVHLVVFDNTKSREVLGLKYHTLEETSKAILDDFKAKGWW
ncbi:NAD(P)-binding protein [Panus rudis PR-1116 ss-1]|nr:NAD(P)-binding protein [Panus rudis PR-1116 ss-1]